MSYINEYQIGEHDERPWGSWTVTSSGEGFAVKTIKVALGHTLSLQKHEHRAEHWVIVHGTAEVTIDDEVFCVTTRDAVYIPQRAAHRIANIGTETLVFVEVQLGKQLRESDIERLEDSYCRT